MEFPLKISPEWFGESVLVAASGPSLTAMVARECRLARWLGGWRVLAVNDAYKLAPWADAMYACDFGWWQAHDGAKDFHGARYTSTSESQEVCDNKGALVRAKFPDIRLINAMPGLNFSVDPDHIHYGNIEHSGFQAVNLALLLGAKRVVLVGFDYRFIDGKSHFFGDHPANVCRQTSAAEYANMAKAFNTAPCDRVVNATPGSLVTAYPMVSLDEELRRDNSLPRYGTVPDTHTD